MSAPSYPRLRRDLKLRDVGEETIVLDREHENIHQFNASGSFVIRRCDGTASVGDIAAALAAEFGIDAERALADTGGLIEAMAARGLLEDD